MGKLYEAIQPVLAEFIGAQHMFFVATAPLEADGRVNLSPKGLDTFRILDPHTVAYLDLTGSGVETIAHLRQNGRTTIMFCAFQGPPKILRLYGLGEVIEPSSHDFPELRARFEDHHVGVRAIIRIHVQRIADACGFAVPRYEYVADRDQLTKSAEKKGPEGLQKYRDEKNEKSIDGLPGLRPRAH
jgi:Pyridoxamine 5'-phosphate oxidase